jgi:polyferredoxin
VLAFITAATYVHVHFSNAGRPVGVDALCPFGGIETLFTLISGAGFIEKVAASAVVLLIGTIVLALVYRRSFCGQICPLGTLQGLFGSLGGRFMRKRPTVPRGIDRFARFLKYGILAFFAVWSWQAAELVMRPYDPWVAFTHITSSELLAEFAVGAGILALSLAGSLIYERFFCKYLCPMGAFLGLFSKLSWFSIKRDADACIDCGACDKACPMNIKVSTAEKITASECISCNECVNSCPAAGALEVSAPSGKAFSAAKMTGVVVAVLAVIVAVSTVAGAFTWTMPSLKDAVEGAGHSEGYTETGSSSSSFDTTLIKGYMSMAEIADASGIPAERFTEKYGVPAADLGKPMKEIKDQYGFLPDDVKVWVEQELAK